MMSVDLHLDLSYYEHLSYLESRFGTNVSCECAYRIKLLIDMGLYELKHPNEAGRCMYSCRSCQYNRMMNTSEYTFRL